jgi:asparagine N-glycosylation enzyme membrane subunit Stt3
MRNNTVELVISLVLVVLAVGVLNPMHTWMPDMTLSLLLAAVFVIFCAFAVFVLREYVTDEREAAHRAVAGRIAFLVGSGVLVLGIMVEGSKHAVDPWLVISLVAMILGKIGTRVYSYYRL